MKIIVVGGGAAGLTAAIIAARNGAEVRVLEAMQKPASKILMTGGGRCNYTNYNLDAECYTSQNELINNLIYSYDASDTISFFESIGVYPVIRNGYVYPRTEEAKTVADALINECEKLKIKIHNNTKVIGINKCNTGFKIVTEGYEYDSDKVIIATGGLSKTDGCARYGYDIARGNGHSINYLMPALTGLVSKETTKASGVRTRAKISLYDEINETGEIQITNFGISGIPVLNISKYVSKIIGKNGEARVVLDFLPELSDEEYNTMHKNGVSLKALLPEKLCDVIGQDDPKKFVLLITSVKEFDYAQVTAGGIAVDEINPCTMESKIVPDLYFAGEIIDVDGKCGGYNLHFAWASATLAAMSATGKVYIHIMPTFEQLRRWENAEIGSRREN